METQGRWAKLTNRMRSEGVVELTHWAFRWTYWNGQLFRVPGMQQLRIAYKYRRSDKKYGIKDPILVYQMGKVGSTSVVASLLALDLDVPVRDMHFLNDLDEHEQWLRMYLPDDSSGFHLIRLGRQIRREMEHAPHQRWNIISLVRSPVSRGISGFFQNLVATFPPYRERIGRNALTSLELADYFANQYYDRVPLQWFDRQVRDVFGIDVYATEFPKARGYQIYEKDNYRLLVIRLEDMNRCAGLALLEFLNIPSFKLISKNVGVQKQYGSLYREFLDNLRLTPVRLKLWHDCQ